MPGALDKATIPLASDGSNFDAQGLELSAATFAISPR